MSFLASGSRSRRRDNQRSAVTYRHLLSNQAMNTSNPLRVIAHCDIDAAYAQFEMVRLGIPEDQPVGVRQWQGLIAINYPARKFGITRHMTADEAKKKCPELQMVHVATYREGDVEPGRWDDADPRTHKVSLDPYRRESSKIIAIFKSMVTEGEVEKASIDEAFLDLTLLTIKEILRRHPHLASVPFDAPHGMDTPLPPPPPISWTEAGNVFPIRGEPKDGDSTVDHDGNDEEGTEGVGGWEDVALCIGAELMAKLRAEVRENLGYTCSAGIAHNKTLAKLCSAWKKPNAQTIMRSAAVPAFLNPMPFTKIRNLGGKLGEAMAAEYQANTVGDMLTVSLEEMQKKFGEESIWVFDILRGIDNTPVKERTATKSMLASKNINPVITTREAGYHWLAVLAGELYVRLRDAREVTDGLWPKSIVLGTRQAFKTSRSRQTNFPFTRHLSTEYIAKYANKLWDEVTEPMTRSTNGKSAMRVDNLALSFYSLERLEGGQQGIEGFFGGGPLIGPSSTASLKRSRSGSPAPVAAKDISRKTVTKQVNKRVKLQNEVIEILTDSDDDDDITQDGPTWTCPKCKRVFRVSEQEESPRKKNREKLTARLEAIKREHQDFHVARDLHHQERHAKPVERDKVPNNPNGKRAHRPPTKREGIKAFFTPFEDSRKKKG
ncbi:hypothetical protein NliqN6_5643 [Naganishia liquefaciens]|uniref:DNA polymerase eta n=1 Tax=Naganishia liquefaciens TaxID=104408 RepID=A0A8H3TYI7_9TREE|nr:hypothetical protein NliqN6_5643 [Naganishia liquefaciens]